MKAKRHLEHVIFNSWNRNRLKTMNAKIIVGVSGGSDSMALLNGLITCFSKNRIVVVHCHHGSGDNLVFRDSAQNLVETFCRQNQIDYEIYRSSKMLKSEADCREFRLDSFQVSAKKHKTKIIALAHHRDDWLETQLLKLIRGSSFFTLKKSFQWSRLKSRDFVLWRPFSSQTRSAVDAYRHECQIPFAEDPSNKNNKYFRNWLRNDWLPRLEKTRPGAVNRLALSLIHSLGDIQTNVETFPWDFKSGSIDLIYFLSLTRSEKLRCLAFYVRSRGIFSIKASQLKEIIRQLDNDKDHHHIHFKTFECLINAGQLMLRMR